MGEGSDCRGWLYGFGHSGERRGGLGLWRLYKNTQIISYKDWVYLLAL